MRLIDCKNVKDFYHWCMYRDGMSNWIPWDNLPQASKQWWGKHFERTKREYYETGREREETRRPTLNERVLLLGTWES